MTVTAYWCLNAIFKWILIKNKIMCDPTQTSVLCQYLSALTNISNGFLFLLQAFLLIFFSELGDKTFFIAVRMHQSIVASRETWSSSLRIFHIALVFSSSVFLPSAPIDAFDFEFVAFGGSWLVLVLISTDFLCFAGIEWSFTELLSFSCRVVLLWGSSIADF